MTDFSKLMEKAKEIESKMRESQENIKKIEVEGVSGANDVKVTLNGEGTMISIKLSENVLKEEREFVVGALESKFEKLTPNKIQEIMVNDIKNNGNWYLNENGDGLLLYVTRTDGSFIPIMDANGNKLEMSFLDFTTIMPITNKPFTYDELDIVIDDDTG